MANTLPPTDGQRSNKRMKFSMPEPTNNQDLARSRVSIDSLLSEPLPSSNRSRSKSRLGFSKGIRASTGNAERDAAAMVATVFSPSTDKPTSGSLHETPSSNAASDLNISTPLTTTPAAGQAESINESDSPQSRRHVSGPGQFTPRALLKSEDEFERVGINAGEVLSLRGDQIAWWMAEQIIWLHAYLENPQKGTPLSLDARPRNRVKSVNGRDVDHCCPQGGITHLKPCNMSAYPPTAEAFGFAPAMRDDLLPQHHASKGGINTIAYVGDLVLEKLAGLSKIDEEEFKLVAGSEHIRQHFGRGYKRYKAPDPHVDPTKQPILVLKSFKKLSQHEGLVAQLKTRYSWALSNYQRLVGASSPTSQLLQTADSFRPSPGIKLAPLLKASPAPPPPRRERKGNDAPLQRRRIEGQPPPPRALHEEIEFADRPARKLDFPLRVLNEGETNRAAASITQICNTLELLFSPTALFTDDAALMPKNSKSKGKAGNKRGKGAASRKRGSSDEGVDLLLILANGGPFTNGKADQPEDEGPIDEAILTAPFRLHEKLELDQAIKELVEVAVSELLRRLDPEASRKYKSRLSHHLQELRRLFSRTNLACNVAVGPAHSAALSRLFKILISLPRSEKRDAAAAAAAAAADPATPNQTIVST